MFAGQHDTPIDLAEVTVVLAARLVRPIAAAAERERHPVPGHRDTVLEFAAILRVNGGPEFDRALDPLGRRHGGELVGIGAVEQIGPEQHAAT